MTGAMEAAGVAGPSRGQVPSHRLLYCSTAEGKVWVYCTTVTEGEGRTDRIWVVGEQVEGTEGL